MTTTTTAATISPTATPPSFQVYMPLVLWLLCAVGYGHVLAAAEAQPGPGNGHGISASLLKGGPHCGGEGNSCGPSVGGEVLTVGRRGEGNYHFPIRSRWLGSISQIGQNPSNT